MIKISAEECYAAGVRLACVDLGITKTAEENPDPEMWPGLFGPIVAGLAAPEGRGWGAAGATVGGQMLGGLGGGALGGGVGAGIAALLRKNPALGALVGGLPGAALGTAYGGMKGYQGAIS